VTAKPRRTGARTPLNVGQFVTPERLEHGDVLEVETDTSKAGRHHARNRTQTALDRYLCRKTITPRQFDAGDKLYRLWRASGGKELRAAGYEPRVDRGHFDMSPRQVQAREYLDAAMREVGKQLSPVLVHVCICGLPAKDWQITVRYPGANEKRRAGRAGVEILRLALDALVGHWRV